MKRTKIVATIGPTTQELSVMRQLVQSGVDVFRLNMSHGDAAFYKRVVQNLKKLRAEGVVVGLLWDLQGPEVRTGDVPEPYSLEKGDHVCLTSRPSHETDKGVIPVSYDQFADDLQAGDQVLLDNGSIKVEVLSVQGTEVRCKLLSKARVRSRMHVNLSGKKLKLPSLSQKDLKDLKQGVRLGTDWFALSFVRSAKDVLALREHLVKLKSKALVMSKIETPDAVADFENILNSSDAIMVARGDLGAEMPFEMVPNIQDDIVAACRSVGKPVVIATHMLESMMESPSPTRAEATDISHAVMSGVDATMLSGETAIGEYPVEAVKAMARIIVATEVHLYVGDGLMMPNAVGNKQEVLLSACELANKISADALLVFSETGRSASMASRNRPNAPIRVFISDAMLATQLQLYWGIDPVFMKFLKYPEATLKKSITVLKKQKKLKNKDQVVVVSDTLMSRSVRVSSVLLMSVE